MNTRTKKMTREEKTSGVEKPISLWGPPFIEVLEALLKTKPMPKGKENVKSSISKED